ncbi:Hypothetical predicted protein, partial [Olea europaea subsp. europaea]
DESWCRALFSRTNEETEDIWRGTGSGHEEKMTYEDLAEGVGRTSVPGPDIYRSIVRASSLTT